MTEKKAAGPSFEQKAVQVLAQRLIAEGEKPEDVRKLVEAEFDRNVKAAGKGGE